MSAAWLAELQTYFASNATLKRMDKVSNRYVKCAMCLSSRQNVRGSAQWFLLRWNNLSEAQQEAFRWHIGEKVLRLEAPSMFCVHVLEGAKQAVVFYIHSHLQKLADAWFHERPLPRYRLEDALAHLHNAQPTDWPFTNQAYDVAPRV
jgi:hypothetical protein